MDLELIAAQQNPMAWRAVDTARLGTSTACALAALSGLAYASGFPPRAWTAAPWVALAPLLIACAALPPARAALAGMVWAATAAAAVASFVPGMLTAYFGLGAGASWLATIAVVGGLHGVYVGAYAAWVAWLVRRRAANPLLVAGGWLACEMVRAHAPLGSPWALSGYSQVGWPVVLQIADATGVYGIGLLLASVNAIVAAAVVPQLRGRRPRVATAIVAAALLATASYGHWRLRAAPAAGPELRVAVVQAGASPAREAERPARLARYAALTRQIAPAPGALVVWPEYATEAYLDEPSAARDTVLGLATDLDVDLLLGAPHYEATANGTRYHNSAYLVRDRRIAGRYDKHRLVPFAEAAYSPGAGSSVLAAGGTRVGMLLCVEAMFPELAAAAVREGATLLVTLSNDAWFGDPAAARQQLDIATLRAVETRRYLVRAAATGISAVVDPSGRVLAAGDFDRRDAFAATVHPSRLLSPYQRWGDAPAWLVIAAVVAASLRTACGRATN